MSLPPNRIRLSVEISEIGWNGCGSLLHACYAPTLRAETGRQLEVDYDGLVQNYKMIVKALPLSAVQLEDLAVISHRRALPIYDLALDKKDFSAMVSLFKSVRRLHLRIEPRGKTFVPAKQDQNRLARIHAQAPQLEALQLSIAAGTKTSCLGGAFLELTFPSLKDLTLFFWAGS